MKRIFSKIVLVALVFGLLQPLEIQANDNNAKIAFGLGTIVAGLTSMVAARLFFGENKRDCNNLERCEKKAQKLNNDLYYLEDMEENNDPGRMLFYLQERSINNLSTTDTNKDHLRFAAGIAGINPNDGNARQFLNARIGTTRNDIIEQQNTNDDDLKSYQSREKVTRFLKGLFCLAGYFSTIFGVYKLSQAAQ